MSSTLVSPPILIFGATGAIGKNTARKLKNNKMNLILASSQESEDLINLSNEIKAPYIAFDFLSNKNENILSQKIKSISENLGGLIISIGRQFPKKFIHNTDEKILLEQLYIHIIALHKIIKICLPMLEKAKNLDPKITYISTEYLLGNPPIKIGPYLAAKSAANTYMKVLSNEVIKKNIRTFILCPGMIRSKLTSDFPEIYLSEIEEKMPRKRLTNVDEISNTILSIYKGYLNASYGIEIQVSVADRR